MLVILLSLTVLALQRYLVYDEDGNPGLQFSSGSASSSAPVLPDDLQITIQRPDTQTE